MDCLTLVFQDETPEHHTVAAEAGRITEEAVRFWFRFASLCINCVAVTTVTKI